MKKKQELTNDVSKELIFSASHKFIFESTKNFIELYKNKYKMLQWEIINHDKEEPLRIFKKAHKNWELKRERLNIELEEVFNNLMEEYEDFDNLI